MNIQNPPFVSVLMTSFNREKYIHESIESVLSQSYKNWELVILDDCSTDSTLFISNQYSIIDSRIKVFSNKVNIGQFANRNKIVEYSNYEILMYLDSDDTLKQNAIEFVVDNISKVSNVSYACIYHYSQSEEPFVLSSRNAIVKHFFDQNLLSIGPGGTVITKSLFYLIGGFPTNYGPVGDMYYNINAASNSNVLFLTYNYLNYRIHNGQEINNRYSYLYNGYLYFKDALMNISNIPLYPFEIKYLLLKNKRRFLINSFKYLFSTFNLLNFLKLYCLAGFGLSNIVFSIFQSSKKIERFAK